MRRIVDYKLIRLFVGSNFSDQINDLIQQGWQPYGNPYGSDSWDAQAMVRYEAEKC